MDKEMIVDLTGEENDDWLKTLAGGKYRKADLAIHTKLEALSKKKRRVGKGKFVVGEEH